MIQVTPQMRILVAVEPADFRKGIDGLVRLSREALKVDPFSGGVFVFRNRRGTALKILVYDGQGFWLCHKRLSEGRFRWWPAKGGDASCRLEAHKLQLLLWNGNPSAADAPLWRPISPR
ncbi:MAG: IS66 family insertion sequence element accessory protein TnpB [Planctomycetota bacterium]|nr:IS66 family insertion sequence element accessory protein TnpB [Planctomycetota bacterium]